MKDSYVEFAMIILLILIPVLGGARQLHESSKADAQAIERLATEAANQGGLLE
jgi:hypothetical protein